MSARTGQFVALPHLTMPIKFLGLLITIIGLDIHDDIAAFSFGELSDIQSYSFTILPVLYLKYRRDPRRPLHRNNRVQYTAWKANTIPMHRSWRISRARKRIYVQNQSAGLGKQCLNNQTLLLKGAPYSQLFQGTENMFKS